MARILERPVSVGLPTKVARLAPTLKASRSRGSWDFALTFNWVTCGKPTIKARSVLAATLIQRVVRSHLALVSLCRAEFVCFLALFLFDQIELEVCFPEIETRWQS